MRFLSSLILSISLLFAASESFAQTSPTFRDCSIASLSGASQTLLAAPSFNRKYLLVCNFGTSNSVGVNFAGGTAAIAGAGTYTLPDTGGPVAQCKEFSADPGGTPLPPAGIVTVIGTSGQPVQCWEGR